MLRRGSLMTDYSQPAMLQEKYMAIVGLYHTKDASTITTFYQQTLVKKTKDIHSLEESKETYAEILQAWQEQKINNSLVRLTYGALLKLYHLLWDYEFLKQKNELINLAASSIQQSAEMTAFTGLIDEEKGQKKEEKKEEESGIAINQLKLEVLSFFENVTRDQSLEQKMIAFNETVQSQFSATACFGALDEKAIQLEQIIELEKSFASISKELSEQKKTLEEQEDAYFDENIAKVIKEMPENKKEKIMRLMQVKLKKSVNRLEQIKKENEEKNKMEEEKWKTILIEITALEKNLSDIVLPKKSIFNPFSSEIAAFFVSAVTVNQDCFIKYKTDIYEQRNLRRQELTKKMTEIEYGFIYLQVHYIKSKLKKKESIKLILFDILRKNQEKIDLAWRRCAEKIIQPFKEELEEMKQNTQTKSITYQEVKSTLSAMQNLYEQVEAERFLLVGRIEEINDRPKGVLDTVFAAFLGELSTIIQDYKSKHAQLYETDLSVRLKPFRAKLAIIKTTTPTTSHRTLKDIQGHLAQFAVSEEKEVIEECEKFNQSPSTPSRIMTPVRKIATEVNEILFNQQREYDTKQSVQELRKLAQNRKNLVSSAVAIKPPVALEYSLPEYNWCYAILLGFLIPVIGFFIYGCYYRRQYHLARTAIPRQSSAANSPVFYSNNVINVLLDAQNEPDSAMTPSSPAMGLPFQEKSVAYRMPVKSQRHRLRKSKSQDPYPTNKRRAKTALPF